MRSRYKFFIVALILGIIAWIVFFVISKNEATNPNEAPTTGSITNTENTENPGENNEARTTESFVDEPAEDNYYSTGTFKEIKKISDVPVKFYWYYSENNRIFYITDGGEIKKVIDGKSEKVSINPLKDVTVVRSNYDGSLVLLKFVAEDAVVWGVFSSMDEKIIPLNAPIIDIIWDSNDQDLIGFSNLSGKIGVVSFSASKNYSDAVVLIPEIKLFDVDLIKKSQDELLFVEKFGNGYTTSIWQYNLKTKMFSVLRKNLLDFSIKTDRDIFFFLSKNDGFVIGDASFNKIMPTINSTIPNKCSVSFSSNAICFVPQTEVSFFDWITNSIFTNDLLYIYDLNREIEEFVDLSHVTKNPIDAKDLISTHYSLYFINKYDNFIYALN